MPPCNENKIYTVTPVITAGAYSAGDVVGGMITIPVSGPGGGGTLRRIIIADDDNEKAALKIHFFTSQPTVFADNAAYAPVIADLVKLIGVVPVASADYTTVNGNAYGIVQDLGIDFFVEFGNLYAYVVCDATPTYAAVTDLTLRFGFWQD
jgi:hypothetical protein